MLLTNLIKKAEFEIINFSGSDCEVKNIFCSDLHSYALNKLGNHDIWITVTSHINTLAVACQKNIACLIIADDIRPDESIIKNAQKHNITILLSKLPVFETSIIVHNIINNY